MQAIFLSLAELNQERALLLQCKHLSQDDKINLGKKEHLGITRIPDKLVTAFDALTTAASYIFSTGKAFLTQFTINPFSSSSSSPSPTTPPLTLAPGEQSRDHEEKKRKGKRK